MQAPLKTAKAWKQLEAHCSRIKRSHLRDLFATDPNRAKNFSLLWNGIYFDYSKNLIDRAIFDSLIQLAEERQLKRHIEEMYTGQKINRTENRAVLHVALRNTSNSPIFVDNCNIMPQIVETRNRMMEISDMIRTGQWKGYSGKKIKNVVNIGIGGSDLGPRMVIEALRVYTHPELSISMVSNVDGAHLSETLRHLDPEETLFIVVSKTFTTQETIANATSAKSWILERFKDHAAIMFHFLGISANKKAAVEFGISTSNILNMWDWVGGRYSLTSAVGLSIMIAIGGDAFMQLLEGFHAVDNHFRYEELNRNIPVIMALLGIWYINFFHTQSHAVIPYAQYLDQFLNYLQQADMESNGKRVDKEGNLVDYATGPVIWGGTGTNAQHAFFQLLHQGTQLVPCDFIGFINPLNPLGDHHSMLLSNLLAQTQALAFGKTKQEVIEENIPEPLAQHRTFAGNKPSNCLLLDKLTPYSLGQLIALYEHKIFVQGIIWDIYSFDQWGVELGKQMADKILPHLMRVDGLPVENDMSTNALIRHILEIRK